MLSSAESVECPHCSVANFGGDRNDFRSYSCKEVFNDGLSTGCSCVAEAREGERSFINGYRRRMHARGLAQAGGKWRAPLFARDDGYHRRRIEKHQRSPDNSSKKALSAGFPPGLDILSSSSHIGFKRSASGSLRHSRSYSLSTASRIVAVRLFLLSLARRRTASSGAGALT